MFVTKVYQHLKSLKSLTAYLVKYARTSYDSGNTMTEMWSSVLIFYSLEAGTFLNRPCPGSKSGKQSST